MSDQSGSTLATILQRQVHFVSGKGGVGKSAVSAALALRFVREGHKTLLVQVNAQDSHGPLLDVGTVGTKLVEVEPNLIVVNTTPAESLREYALMTLKVQAIYRAVFENRLTKTFLRFLPALAELTMLGKIYFHATESEDDGGPRFPRIVVDCPSTGHGLQLLKVADVIQHTVRVGPLAEKTAKMAALVADEKRCALHIVAIAEELPVNEGLELLDEVRRTSVVPPGALVLNRVLRHLFDDVASASLQRARAAAPALTDATSEVDARMASLLDVGERRRSREHVEREQALRLRDTGLPLVMLPLVLTERLRRPDVERFAQEFQS